VTDEQERDLRTQERLRAIRAAGTNVAAMLKPPLYRSVDEQGSTHPCTKMTSCSWSRVAVDGRWTRRHTGG
jgi:hypothetical protein